MNNREHTREHMIFQIMVNTDHSEEYLENLMPGVLLDLYKIVVRDVEGVKVK